MAVICATDFSEWAQAAEVAGAIVAGRLGEELWLVHALEPGVEEIDPGPRDKLMGQLHKRLEARAAALRTHAKVVKTVVEPGHADRVIRGLAEEKRASLVLVGSAGHSAGPLVRLGGTSERLVSASGFPVLVVRDASPFEAWGAGKNLRLLVGVDESAASASAIRWVQHLRRAAPVDVVIGRVYYADEAHRRYGVPRRVSLIDPDPTVEALIERDLKRTVPHLAGNGETFYRARLGLGRIADHLLELAEAERCNLVVVGSHARKGIARMWSVSAATVHLARMSVAVVPPDGQGPAPMAGMARFKRVMVTTDFSPFADAAVPWAYAMTESGGEVTLAHVTLTKGPLVDQLVDQYLIGPQPRGEVEAEVAMRLRGLTPAIADEKAVATRTEILRAPEAAAAIVEASERLGVDAIVLSSHGRSGLARTVMGSVAEAVLRTSKKPVLVVRPTGR